MNKTFIQKMKTKIKKFIFEYSRNSRITTKELGKKIGASQQSASYLKNQLLKKNLIKPVTVIDAVKLGFVNVLVGFNFLNPEYSLKREIINELRENESITSIEEGKEGVDLLVEYSTKNLSAFNKAQSETIYKYFKKLKTTFVYPIIVFHEYQKKYLSRKQDYSDSILFGDRALRELSENERKVLKELVKDPDIKIIDLSELIEIPVKSVINLKKSLEKKFVIKRYSSILDNSRLGISRQVVFLRFSSEGIKQIDKFGDYAKFNKNIIGFMKIIGEYQVAIVVEDIKEIDILKDIRSNFPIESYHVIKSEKIHKKQYLPEEVR